MLLYLDPETQKWEVSVFSDESKARIVVNALGMMGISKVYLYTDIIDSQYVECMKGNFGHTNKEILQMGVLAKEGKKLLN